MSGPCPSCRGNPREEVDGEVYVCPDCAGTGKAANSITANEKLRDAAPRLAAALKAMVKREAAQQTLLMNYRLGKRPTERALDDLSETRGAPEEARAALRETGATE